MGRFVHCVDIASTPPALTSIDVSEEIDLDHSHTDLLSKALGSVNTGPGMGRERQQSKCLPSTSRAEAGLSHHRACGVPREGGSRSLQEKHTVGLFVYSPPLSIDKQCAIAYHFAKATFCYLL